MRFFRKISCAVIASLFLAGGPANFGSKAEPQNGGSWPREIPADHETITLYQPQVQSWKGDQLEQRAAVGVRTASSAEPLYGVIWLEARTRTDRNTGIVALKDLKITRGSFPTASAAQKAEALSALRREAAELLKQMPLERLKASLAITKAESLRTKESFNNRPPRIIYSASPAILVLVDGQPVLRETGSDGLLRVINSRALLLLDRTSAEYYFFMGDRWMRSPSLSGPWVPAKDLPGSLSRSLDQAKQSAVQNRQVDLLDDPQSALMRGLGNGIVPRVFVSTRPAELIQTEGAARFEPIGDSRLLYVSNSGNSIFLDTTDQRYYALISGRWYRASRLGGPWKFVSAKKLPAEFARIPENHPKGAVLSSVAGTPQAQEAGISNEVPQTATVSRETAAVGIQYDGAPIFKPIEGTSLRYAVNSPTPVIEVDANTYYSVQNGIWFVSGSPQGPWSVATRVPPVIYTIPPSSPLYYVTYVYVYDSTPSVVYVGYLPGYLGSYYSADGVVVYGTGYYYPPWIGTVWFGWPVTFGFAVGWGPFWGWTYPYPYAPFYPWWGPWRWGWQQGTYHYNPQAITRINSNKTDLYHGWSSNVVSSPGRGGTGTAVRGPAVARIPQRSLQQAGQQPGAAGARPRAGASSISQPQPRNPVPPAAQPLPPRFHGPQVSGRSANPPPRPASPAAPPPAAGRGFAGGAAPPPPPRAPGGSMISQPHPPAGPPAHFGSGGFHGVRR